jgi:hypothetical protein
MSDNPICSECYDSGYIETEGPDLTLDGGRVRGYRCPCMPSEEAVTAGARVSLSLYAKRGGCHGGDEY